MKFRVEHFTKYGFDDLDDEGDDKEEEEEKTAPRNSNRNLIKPNQSFASKLLDSDVLNFDPEFENFGGKRGLANDGNIFSKEAQAKEKPQNQPRYSAFMEEENLDYQPISRHQPSTDKLDISDSIEYLKKWSRKIEHETSSRRQEIEEMIEGDDLPDEIFATFDQINSKLFALSVSKDPAKIKAS